VDGDLERLAAAGAKVFVRAAATADGRSVLGRSLVERSDGGLEFVGARQSEGAEAPAGRDVHWWFGHLYSLLTQDPTFAGELRRIIDACDRAPSPWSAPAPHPPVPHIVPGDHLDFRQGLFHGPVVGVQHNYGTRLAWGVPPDPGSWPLLAEVDPTALGVRPARGPRDGAGLPAYVERDVDSTIKELFGRADLFVVTGGPLSGTTRTAWHVMAGSMGPDTRIHAPAPGTDLRGIPGLLRGREGSFVLWLDDLEPGGHLGEHGLDAGLLTELAALRVPVVATMKDDVYDEHRFGGGRASRVLSRAVVVELGSRWSERELARLATAAAGDARLADALRWRGQHSVPEYLAVGHDLWELWRRAARPGGPHPRGHLLVRAAVDLARCGVTGDIPLDLLRAACGEYGAAATAEAARETHEEAFAWAAERRHGVTGLLVRGARRAVGESDETWRACGSLVADALRDDALPPVPFDVWHCAVEETYYDGDVRENVLTTARSFFAPKAAAGDVDALHMMGILSEAAGDEDAELDWLRKAVAAGKTELSAMVGGMLLDRKEAVEALPYLQAAVAHQPGGYQVRLLAQAHRALAEHYLREAVRQGDRYAMHELGDLLHGAGAHYEALRWYGQAADAGHEHAATSVGNVLYDLQDINEAEAWYRRGVEQGDAYAMHALATLLDNEQRHDDEVEQLYRAAVDADLPGAAAHFGTFLIGTGAEEEGTDLLRRAAEGGDEEATYQLACRLDQQPDGAEEAEKWFREAAGRGHYYARKHLSEQMADHPDPPATVME
jgi:TPR repeat protein